MKDVIIKSLKENRWGIAIQIILIGVNIYLLTFPSKIIGNIIDLFYDLEANQENIMNNTYYLLGICIVFLYNRKDLFLSNKEQKNKRHSKNASKI